MNSSHSPGTFAVLCAALIALALLGSCAQFSIWFPGKGVQRFEDLPYAGDKHPRHALDLFVPAERGFATVIFVHGGYWRNGDRRYYRPLVGLYSNMGIALARRGIAGAVISYRLVPEVRAVDQAQDVARAFAYIRAHIAEYGGDPQAIFLAGHSAGGHLTALLASDARYLSAADPTGTSALRGAVTFSGIFDLVHMRERNDAQFNAEKTTPAFGSDDAALTTMSPRTYFSAKTVPLLVLLGARDYAFIREQTPPAVDLLKQTGAAVEFFEAPAYEHEDMVLNFGNNGDPLIEQVVNFVNQRRK